MRDPTHVPAIKTSQVILLLHTHPVSNILTQKATKKTPCPYNLHEFQIKNPKKYLDTRVYLYPYVAVVGLNMGEYVWLILGTVSVAQVR
jgi:hypothetical protein